MRIPQEVQKILDTITRAGFEAYAVGGCVRDACLGRTPEDWDITTDALPAEVKKLFRRTVDTGLKHGTVTVLIGNTGYEITTYRVDGAYSDGRHPDSVAFTPELSEDLKRRDFTINAMACAGDGSIVDLFGGRKDLQAGLIRCVGDPDERFSEDALRILRALRFSAQLSFEIEGATMEALKRHAPNLVHVSRERILAELNKMILSPHPERMALLAETGIAPYIGDGLKDFCPSPDISKLPQKKDVRWAAGFWAAEKGKAREFLKGLKSDNETADGAELLSSALREPLPEDLYGTRRLLSGYGEQRTKELILLRRAGFGTPVKEGAPEAVEEMAGQILKKGDCLSVGGLAVSGRDLMRDGIGPGPELGRTLSMLLDCVLREPELNDADTLRRIAAERNVRDAGPGGKSENEDASE